MAWVVAMLRCTYQNSPSSKHLDSPCLRTGSGGVIRYVYSIDHVTCSTYVCICAAAILVLLATFELTEWKGAEQCSGVFIRFKSPNSLFTSCAESALAQHQCKSAVLRQVISWGSVCLPLRCTSQVWQSQVLSLAHWPGLWVGLPFPLSFFQRFVFHQGYLHSLLQQSVIEGCEAAWFPLAHILVIHIEPCSCPAAPAHYPTMCIGWMIWRVRWGRRARPIPTVSTSSDSSGVTSSRRTDERVLFFLAVNRSWEPATFFPLPQAGKPSKAGLCDIHLKRRVLEIKMHQASACFWVCFLEKL